jgi:uncharacterized protein YuzE
MAEKATSAPWMLVQYDEQADILTFAFTASPQPAVAEEAADEVWVRYDPQTRRVLTVDVLNFSARVHAAFGPTLTTPSVLILNDCKPCQACLCPGVSRTPLSCPGRRL